MRSGVVRFEWLYVTGFVEPATGRTVWNVSNAISKAYFELVLADFAKSVGAGPNKRIVLQLDNAGRHGPQNLAVPNRASGSIFQPAHSPELQPAEHLWAFVDEPLVNRYFETIEDLDKAVGERCLGLHAANANDQRQHPLPLVALPAHQQTAMKESTGVGIRRCRSTRTVTSASSPPQL